MFKDCLGIIDCTHWKIVVPTMYVRQGQKSAFMDRKFTHTLTFQLLSTCEASPRFLDIDGGQAGCAYDTRVLESSNIFTDINKYLEAEEYFMGDLGYPLRPYMMTGFKK